MKATSSAYVMNNVSSCFLVRRVLWFCLTVLWVPKKLGAMKLNLSRSIHMNASASLNADTEIFKNVCLFVIDLVKNRKILKLNRTEQKGSSHKFIYTEMQNQRRNVWTV